MAPVPFAQLGAAPVMLSLLYGATFLHALGKLRMLHRSSRSLGAKKLFTMSILLSCLTRTMGFVTIGALNLQSVRFADEGSPKSSWRDDAEERFYERTIMVLFDLPDFMIISAYTLLAVVWAEAYLQSRRHWLSARVYKRQLLLGYMIFNAALYAGQLVLYSLLFLPYFSKSGLLSVIYLFLTTVNLLLPLLLAVLMSYFTCTFSGFPYKSEGARIRMRRVGRVLMLWTAARVVWGVSALSAVLEYQRLVGNSTSLREQVYSIIVVALFLATELYPFLAALDDEVLLAMSAEDVARAGGGSDGTDPGRNRGGREAEEAGPNRGQEVQRNRGARQATLVPTLSAATEGNPRQPLLPPGHKTESWNSLSSDSVADQRVGLNTI
ncbi:unnamed protein product [Ascophyllum nodosum]